MKTWQEALKILLIQIKLPVPELAEMTGTNFTSIYKFIQGTNNSTAKTVQLWLEACERYEPGSWKMFHLLCADHIKGEPEPVELRVEKPPKSRKEEIEEYVEALDLEELSEHLSAIAKCMQRYRRKSEIYYQPKDVSLIEGSEIELEEKQMCLNFNETPLQS